jgi:hypothetical protein
MNSGNHEPFWWTAALAWVEVSAKSDWFELEGGRSPLLDALRVD